MFIKMVIFQHDSHEHQRHEDKQHYQVHLFPQEFKGILVTVTYCSVSFVCHFNLLPLQKELRQPTRARMNIIVVGTMLLAYALYNLVIFSGFFTVSFCV